MIYPRHVKPGEAINAADYNKLIDCVRAATPIAGENVRVSTSLNGSRIDAQTKGRGGASSVDEWFAIKWDDTHGWIVEVRPQSCTLAGCVVHMEPVGATGFENWYKIVNRPSTDVAGTFVAHVHVKGRVKIGNGNILPAIVVTGNPSGYFVNADLAGDIYSAQIGSCSTTIDQQTSAVTHSVSKDWSKQIDFLSLPVAKELELYWAIASNAYTGYAPHVEAQTQAPICGIAMADTALPSTGSTVVYYQIDCSGSAYAPSIQLANNASPSIIGIPVYSLVDGNVAQDTRSGLCNQVFYT